jgi:plastocyanin
MNRARPVAAAVLLALFLAVTLGADQPADKKDQKDKKDDARTVTIKNLKYDPKEIRIKAGQKLVWINKDDNDHTVTADDNSFKSDNLGNGDKFEFTFKKPGKYTYHCKYHPRMKAVVIVE